VNHEAMIDYCHERDKTRLVHCEDCSRRYDVLQKELWAEAEGTLERPYTHEEKEEMYAKARKADIFSRMYTDIPTCWAQCKNEYNRQPFFLCEYSHAMGNSPGDVVEYWQCVDANDKFIGGCIWEWADHTVVEDGMAKYGGDWESELTNDVNFCADGLVNYDRSFKAGSYEAKYAYQPMRAALEDGKIKIRNRNSFRNLKEYTLKYQLVVDNQVVCAKETVLDLAPMATAWLELPGTAPAECGYGCYVNMQLLDATGYEVAQEQLDLQVPVKKLPAVESGAKLEEKQYEIIASGEGFRYVFSKHYGAFVDIEVKGKHLIDGPMHLTTLRAPLDNERAVKRRWVRNIVIYGENMESCFDKVYSCELTDGEIVVKGALAGVARMPYLHYTQRIRIAADGAVSFTVDAKVRDHAFWLPRFGYELTLKEADAGFRYFGMGPGESYIDMHHHANYGMWESKASKEYVPYIKPQEHGNHYGVRYLGLDNGLTFVADTPFECNVSQYSIRELFQKAHAAELEKDGKTHVRIDYKCSGIGSASCGPQIKKEYTLHEKEIHFAFVMKL